MGFRIIGTRKGKLIDKLSEAIEEVGNRGIDLMPYLRKKYAIVDWESFKKIPTKKFSGIISDVKDIGRTV